MAQSVCSFGTLMDGEVPGEALTSPARPTWFPALAAWLRYLYETNPFARMPLSLSHVVPDQRHERPEGRLQGITARA